MFDTLSNTFSSVFQFLGGKPRLTEKNIEESLGKIRMALLEADVGFKVVRDFIARVKEKALGTEVLAREGVTAGDHFCKVVYDEVVALLGETDTDIHFSTRGVTVILMAGLQGAGKTTTCGKLARYLKQQGKRPLLVAADVQRPAAIRQLEVVGGQVDVPVYTEDTHDPPGICERSLKEAQRLQRDVVILDTAGRLHIDELLMAELDQIVSRTRPHEVFLVVDGMTGQGAINSTAEFNARLEISGIIMDNMNQGRKKAIWVSVNAEELFVQAKKDVTGAGANPDVLFKQNKTKSGQTLPTRDGILFTTYGTIGIKVWLYHGRYGEEVVTENVDGGRGQRERRGKRG